MNAIGLYSAGGLLRDAKVPEERLQVQTKTMRVALDPTRAALPLT
ncbi:hypothetical protein ABENE_11000 [Asticcacaulis benevestitus DSM 16100 = ATCC BAA-896]|uniref:Uncharacterized protein n=1 Tax=Asticcacaulis benevestitus DSM 16100 = ATCC BAA-896 TaxID=1121022 RepID=V4PZH5_9CAUL|nr:hypothetical protein ABENE_11000 [Asticcacaulis benevestitus DSM 16100 = ATCC BAA-896]